jgi:vacuolar protein sorting-associated protein 35
MPSLQLSRNIYPDRLDYVDQIFAFAQDIVSRHANTTDLHSPNSQASVLRLLLAPLKAYLSIFTALALPHFLPLLQAQPYPTRRSVAGEVARTLLKTQVEISSQSNLNVTLEVMRVIIREGAQASTGYTGPIQRKAAETEETLEEQGWLARIVHLIQSPVNDDQFELLKAAQKAFGEGNERIKFTYPPLVISSLKLARRFKTREHLDDNWNSQCSALYKFINSMLTSLYTRVNGFNDMALRLFVSCAKVADQTGHSELAYEFFAQAFTVYEEVISDSRAQFQAICVTAGALHQTRGFARDDYDTLITKCALHGSKLLKKPDQCRAVYIASHLWWATEIRVLNEDSTKEVCSLVSGSLTS